MANTIYALQSVDHLEQQLERMNSMGRMRNMNAEDVTPVNVDAEKASFLDIFKGMVTSVIDANEQVQQDRIDLMLGNIDDLATVQANSAKLSVAVDLLVSVKNEVISSYNSIINMQI